MAPKAELAGSGGGNSTPRPRKRSSKPKVKTGCHNCKRRKIKCDEQRPSCRRCIKSGIVCDGFEYSSPTNDQLMVAPASESSRLRNAVPIPSLEQWKASHGTKIFSQPQKPLFQNDLEHRCFRIFCDNFATQLGGNVESPVWNCLILQASEQEEAIRQAVIAIGALDLATPSALDRHDAFATRKFGHAIKEMRNAMVSKSQSLRTTLLTCLLIICFENFTGNYGSAVAHMHRGISIIESWISSQATQSSRDAKEKVSDVKFGLKSPAPGIVEDELVQSFGRLELAANSFFEYSPVGHHRLMRHCGDDSLRNMPSSFGSVKEAKDHWELIARRLMHFISAMGDYITPLSPGGYTIIGDEQRGLFNRSLPPLHSVFDAGFAERQSHLDEVEKWSLSFASLFQNAHTLHTQDYFGALTLQIRFLTTRIFLACSLEDQMAYDVHLDDFIEVIRLSKLVLEWPTSIPTFTFDMSLIPQIHLVGIKCRDKHVRREAIALLESRRWREGVWDSHLAALFTSVVMEIEEQGMEGNHIPVEWRVTGLMAMLDSQAHFGTVRCLINGLRIDERKVTW